MCIYENKHRKIVIIIMTHCANGHDAVEVMDVHVDKHSKEACEDLLAEGNEGLGEWHIWRRTLS